MDHRHCDFCVFSNCKGTDCPVAPCENHCGASLHRCKTEEHLQYTCPEAHVPCTNAAYGCEETPKRKELLIHIEHCVASTVMCRFAHDRLSVDKVGASESASENNAWVNTASLLDEKLLLGDMEILRSDEVAAGASRDELVAGGINYTVKYVQAGEEKEENCRLSIDCRVGVVTNASWASKFHTVSFRPRVRTCNKMTKIVSLNCVFFAHKEYERHCCSFPCNEIVRRDEFATHWKCQHLDVQVCMSQIVRRCPMHGYGCSYGDVRLVPGPTGSAMDYNPRTDCYLLSSPSISLEDVKELSGDYAAQIQSKQELALYGYEYDAEESLDVLGQLPAEVLVRICLSLDSLSLWIFSQVNRYIRKVCFNVVKKKGVVFHLWDKDETTGRWTQGPKRWSFAKVFRPIPYWCCTDAPSMGHHMMSCEHLRSQVEPYPEDKVPLAVYHSKPDGKKRRRIADMLHRGIGRPRGT